MERVGTVDIVETAMADGRLDALVTALRSVGLVERLKAEGPFTLFAPTDDAFDEIPMDKAKAITTEELRKILLHHVVEGKMIADDLEEKGSAKTLQGGSLSFRLTDDTLMLDGARVLEEDMEASNGIIHVIDRVLMPKGM